MTMNPPVRLLLTTASNPFVEIVFIAARYWPPALSTRPAMRPWSASTRSTVAMTACSSRMSATCVELEPPSDSISQRTRSSLASLRPTIATWAPRQANSWAVHRPIPLPPPVMTTMWSRNRSRRYIELYDMCSVLGWSAAFGACRYPVGVAPFEELLLALDDLRVTHDRIAIQALKPELVVQGAADDLEDGLLR